MSERVVVLPYEPRKPFLPYHNRSQRFAVGVAHRRCGKTVASVNDMIRNAIMSKKPQYRAGYVAPFFNQAKDIAWEYMKRFAQPILQKVNEGDAWIELVNGARLRIYGADNPDRLRGGYFDDVVLDEYADMYPGIWGSIIRPMLADRLGTATFIGTPKGRNAFFELYQRASSGHEPDWTSFMLRASETGILSQQELDDARKDMTAEQYAQEFECSFDAAILGAYFGREVADAERAGRIGVVPIAEGYPVHTAWDLGKGQNMPVWCFQILGPEIRVVDFLQDYTHTIERICAELDSRGYHGKDYVPHDAKVPSLETGRTRLETMWALKRDAVLVPMHHVDDGINAARLTFPRVWFDNEKCKDGLEALRQYRAEYDEKGRTFKSTPKPDWASHPADAFRYLCMGWRELALPEPKKKPPVMKSLAEMTFDEFEHLDEEIGKSRRDERV